ncbi:MAG: ABC transporter permease subunit [Oscillibacter sp.]|nr:ABC transporter permease subunit [uncultured Oscillibacter sp.]MCI8970911.1 ABC transporter permease subunit [Oscillibacter sp.]
MATKLRPWSVAFWLLVWQGGSVALAAANPSGSLLLASPVRSALRLLELLPSSAFWRAVGSSSLRIFGGFLLSCALALLLASLAVGRPWLRELLAPPVAVVKATPVASFIILALVWLDARSLPLFISALMVFPPVYLNVLEGLRRTDRKLLELAQVYRIPLGRRIRGIYLPQVLPYFRSAASLALGLCWKAGVAAEVIGLPAGTVGERLYTAKIYLQTPDLFAWTAVILLLAAAFEALLLAAVDWIAGKAAS